MCQPVSLRLTFGITQLLPFTPTGQLAQVEPLGTVEGGAKYGLTAVLAAERLPLSDDVIQPAEHSDVAR